MDNLYEIVGFSGANVMVHKVDATTTPATVYSAMASLGTSSGSWVRMPSGTYSALVAYTSMDSAIWADCVPSGSQISDGGAAATPIHRLNYLVTITSMPAGWYKLFVYESATYKSAAKAAFTLYWTGIAWQLPDQVIVEDTGTTIPAAITALNTPASVSFAYVSDYYRLPINRDRGIVSLTARDVRAGEKPTILFEFSDVLDGAVFTSVSSSDDSSNVTIDSTAVDGRYTAGQGITVAIDPSSATAGETFTLSVTGVVGDREYKDEQAFVVV